LSVLQHIVSFLSNDRVIDFGILTSKIFFMSIRYDLNYSYNNDCLKECNKKTRKQVTENDLCDLTKSVNDYLPIRCVGEWGMEKIYLLIQYFGIFATAMKDKWPSINYIEICSGPGRCINRNRGTEFDGTALSIIRHDAFKYIDKALFFDFNDSVIETLNSRK